MHIFSISLPRVVSGGGTRAPSRRRRGPFQAIPPGHRCCYFGEQRRRPVVGAQQGGLPRLSLPLLFLLLPPPSPFSPMAGSAPQLLVAPDPAMRSADMAFGWALLPGSTQGRCSRHGGRQLQPGVQPSRPAWGWRFRRSRTPTVTAGAEPRRHLLAGGEIHLCLRQSGIGSGGPSVCSCPSRWPRPAGWADRRPWSRQQSSQARPVVGRRGLPSHSGCLAAPRQRGYSARLPTGALPGQDPPSWVRISPPAACGGLLASL